MSEHLRDEGRVAPADSVMTPPSAPAPFASAVVCGQGLSLADAVHLILLGTVHPADAVRANRWEMDYCAVGQVHGSEALHVSVRLRPVPAAEPAADEPVTVRAER
jgi:hypothetical protein